MPIKSLRDWKAGDPFSAGHLEEPVLAIRQMGFGATSGDATAYDRGYGIIMDAGPNAEADYTDARYWMWVAYCNSSSSATSNITFKGYTLERGTADFLGLGASARHIVTATNLAELAAQGGTDVGGTITAAHLLKKGTVVKFECVYDLSDPEVRHYAFYSSRLRTTTKTVVTGVVCNGDGTINVTTDTITVIDVS
jgi:hypothetical protein